MPGAETFHASADAYDRFVGRYGPSLAPALVGFAGVKPGMRALDVGCGPGALAAALVDQLGAASVSAADPSTPFVDACKTRLPGVDVVEAPAEALPFADRTFDATLSQLVVNFMGDPDAGVREMARVTRPGGVVASCVWDYAGEMTLLRAFWDAAREIAPERAAGLDSVRFGSLLASANYTDFEDLWSPLPTGVGPAGTFCKSLDEDLQAALRATFRQRLRAGDNPFELTARAWAVAGEVHG